MKKFKLLICIILLAIPLIVYALTYQVKTQIVSVSATATKLPTTPLVGRNYIQIQNVGAITVYIGASTVTADTASTGGTQLLPYATWYAEYDNGVDIYGIVASDTCNVVVEEGK